jgi:hypothetical protein
MNIFLLVFTDSTHKQTKKQMKGSQDVIDISSMR